MSRAFVVFTYALSVLLSLGTCARAPEYRYLRQAENYYQNDRYQFSYTMAGDFEQLATSGQDLEASTEAKRRLTFKRPAITLATFATTVSPFHRHTVLRLPAGWSQRDPPLTPDSLYFELRDTLATVTYVTRGADGRYLAWLATAHRRDARSLLSEYSRMFKTIRVGEGYVRDVLDDPFTVARRMEMNVDSTVNYLLPIAALDKIGKNYTDDHHRYMQANATYHSLAGSRRTTELVEHYRRNAYLGDEGKFDPPTRACGWEAVSKRLLDSAGNYRLVMFNEAHFDPRHRVLLFALLPRLRERGFTHLALEGLWESSDSLRARSFAVSRTGFYTREPQFANLIRRALRLGFTVVPYDSEGAAREAEQAENLYRATFGGDSLARVVVLAGFGHIHEDATAEKKMMAQVFQDRYNIEPLTIDQTEFYLTDRAEVCLVDRPAVPDVQTIRTDLYVANTLDALELPDFKQVTFEVPDTVRRLVSEGERVQLSVYVAWEYSIDPRAIPVANTIIGIPFTLERAREMTARTRVPVLVPEEVNGLVPVYRK